MPLNLRSTQALAATLLFASSLTAASALAQRPPAPPQAPDPVAPLVARLSLDKYKATIKGLTQFGDRRQGTERNRNAVDWIEAQLKSYGCTNTQRIHYEYPTPAGQAGRGNNNDPNIGPG